MIQLEILSGKTAGARWVARRFPVRIGRAPDSDLQLEERGVWERHLQIDLNPGDGFILTTNPEARVIANGQPVEHAVLRNGDLLEIGAVKLRFWLSEARQRGLGFREVLVWAIIAGVCIGQIALIYWLIR
jgi:pSer/pThr/pTyr-binding forkhead associated (FHA) protein